MTQVSGNMTQVSGDMTSGEMTLGRLDCKPLHQVLYRLVWNCISVFIKLLEKEVTVKLKLYRHSQTYSFKLSCNTFGIFFYLLHGEIFLFLEGLKVLPDEAVNVAFRDWNSNWTAYR